MPFGKKRNLEFPLIIKLVPNKTEIVKLLVRGVCDTDGGVDKSRFSIINTDNLLIKQLEDEFRKLKIDFEKKTITKDRKRPAFVLRVPSHQLVKFGIEIGLSHPRKQKELIKILTRETPHRILSNVRKDCMIGGKYFDLDLIPNLYVIGARKIFKELKERANLPETRLANLIDMKERTIKIYEKLPNKAVPFKLLSRMSKFAVISAVDFYSKLKEEKILWSTKGNEVKLPLSLERKILWIAEHVRPKPKSTGKVKIVKMLKGRIIPPKELDKVISTCQKLFNIKVIKGKNEYYINSACLRQFFDTFFEYEPFWKPLSQEESERILREWNDIWFI